jgi:glycosyltransferase involved in cell wall biosynthesis
VLSVFGARADWELLLVDDGSRDKSPEIIRALIARDARVVGVFLARNCGQSAALRAGLREARGALVGTLDAGPAERSRRSAALARALGDNDAVVGYRAKRNDTFVRRASSRIANGVRNWISKDQIRDTGCSLKVFRAEALRSIPWFEGMHRFLPTLLRYQGYKVVEHPVSHHPAPRARASTDPQPRLARFKDLLAVRWMRTRMIRRRRARCCVRA